MPRPSMAAQRKEEILDAFEECILNDSLEATSLEKLAEHAGMKRSILRHYIGNRDDIIVALSERYLGYYAAQWEQTIAWLPDNNRMRCMIDILFGERNRSYVERSIIGDAVFAQAKRIEAVRAHQIESMNQSIDILCNEIRRDYPNAPEKKVALVARGVLAHYLNSESLLPFDMPLEIEELKQVSILLLSTLDTDK